MKPRAQLRLLPLIAATYFMVAGGPYGLEELVQKSGYRDAIIILLVTPVIWSLPVALLVGELSAALPDEGGYYVWVRRALGPFWGFQEAWLSLVASIFDMAIYPTLFILYLGRLWPAANQGHNGLLIGIAVIAACALCNIGGVRAVGGGSILFLLLLEAPFLVLSGLAFVHGAPAARHNGAPFDLLGGMLICMWNYMGWDNASTVAGEVRDPQRNYPRAMIGALVLVTASYVLTVVAVAYSGVDPSTWTTGSWVTVGRMFGGPLLALTIAAGGMISPVGMLNALVMSYSRVPYAMAEDGYLPRAFTWTTRHTHAPWVSIVVCAAAWALCLPLGFDRLIQLDIMLYGAALLLEFVALLALRLREPNLPRPFRSPGGVLGIVVLMLGPAFVLVMAMVRGHQEHEGATNPIVLGAALAVAGVVLYFAARSAKSRPAAESA